MLSFGFTPTKNDYLKAFWVFYSSNWSIWAVLFLAVVPQGICVFTALLRGEFGFGFEFILPLVIFLGLGFILFFAFVISPLRVANKVEKDERLNSPVQYEVNDQGLLFRNQFTETKTDWGSYQKFIETKDMFLLIYSINKNMFQIIPKRAFTSSDDELLFKRLLVSKNLEIKKNLFDIKINPPLVIGAIAFIGVLLCICVSSFLYMLLRYGY